MEENKDIMIKNGDKIVICIGKKALVGIGVVIISIILTFVVFAIPINEYGYPNIINLTGENVGDIYARGFYVDSFLHFEEITEKGICNSEKHGVVVYELDGTGAGNHYACRQKKDSSGWEWKPLY